jgi:hypothetical protein
MKLRIRTTPRAGLLDTSTLRAPETPPTSSPAGPGSRLVPSQRPATPAERIEAPASSPAVPEPRRRRHLRHRWELTGGDDGRHLMSTCQVCGRTRSLARATRDAGVLDYQVEMRRMR